MDLHSKVLTTRRALLAALGTGAAAGTLKARVRPRSPLQAVAFDAFVLFDPSPVVDVAAKLIVRDARPFVAAASAKIFAYTWYYTSAEQYAPFPLLAAASFRSVADAQQISLSQDGIDQIVESYSALALWPDVTSALEILRLQRLRLILLSNLPEETLARNLRSNRVDGFFEDVISTDRARRFKPAPEAYALGIKALRLDRTRIGFAASASWDASGARWFGFPTVWVNRTRAPMEIIHEQADVVSAGMDGVLRLAGTATDG